MSPLRSAPYFDIPSDRPAEDDLPDPAPADAGPGAHDIAGAPRRWQWRTSDKIGMGTFSVTTVSAYLLWSMVQGQDDLRRDLRRVADEQRQYAVTQERMAETQRQISDRVLSHETQANVRFSDLDGRLNTVRRNQEDVARDLRDHDQRLRAFEAERAPTHRTPGR